MPPVAIPKHAQRFIQTKQGGFSYHEVNRYDMQDDGSLFVQFRHCSSITIPHEEATGVKEHLDAFAVVLNKKTFRGRRKE